MSIPQFLGSLANFDHYDSTPHIGTVFSNPSTQVSQLLAAPNSDVLIKDLATLQKQLATRLGELTGKPETSKLHRHPLTPNNSELGNEVTVITNAIVYPAEKKLASGGWHSDITFEHVPSDYAILKIHTLPPSGGDTLWASAYEAYDRLSPAYQRFLEGLTAVHDAKQFKNIADFYDFSIPEGPRGSPLNVGTDLVANHHQDKPVTGFKGLYVNKNFTKRIVELTSDESDDILNYLERHVSGNHDFQINFHTATPDYEGLRQGDRVVSLGEAPFYDPTSKSRREALGLKRV